MSEEAPAPAETSLVKRTTIETALRRLVGVILKSRVPGGWHVRGSDIGVVDVLIRGVQSAKVDIVPLGWYTLAVGTSIHLRKRMDRAAGYGCLQPVAELF